LENFEELPKRHFPLVFHSIIGRDQRENSSPSFFNIDEVTQVKKYCAALVGNRKLRVCECFCAVTVRLLRWRRLTQTVTACKDIMIIAPYHAQVMKLREILNRDPKLRDIEVGSVEEFQGQVTTAFFLRDDIETHLLCRRDG
jgi:helicase MOV-10